jgi:hypothetical protein
VTIQGVAADQVQYRGRGEKIRTAAHGDAAADVAGADVELGRVADHDLAAPFRIEAFAQAPAQQIVRPSAAGRRVARALQDRDIGDIQDAARLAPGRKGVEGVAADFLPGLAAAYVEKGVELRGCAQTCDILGAHCVPATDADWDEEYLAPILSIKVVPDIDGAMDHIARHGSMHTESILTENISKARRFLREVDASSVMVNASTRFADGFEYGLGAEIGISTDKFHVRGPVGLEGLTSVKFIVLGDGHIRE